MLVASLCALTSMSVVPVHASEAVWSAVEFDLQTKAQGVFGSRISLEAPHVDAGLHILDDGRARGHWSTGLGLRYRLSSGWDLWAEARQGRTANAAVPLDYVQASEPRVTRPRAVWREASASFGVRRNLGAYPRLLIPYWGVAAEVSQVRSRLRLEGEALELSSESVQTTRVADAGFETDALLGGHVRGGLSARLNQFVSGVLEARLRGRWLGGQNVDGIRSALQPGLRGHVVSNVTLGFYLDVDL